MTQTRIKLLSYKDLHAFRDRKIVQRDATTWMCAHATHDVKGIVS
jgi:hypothetical protein